MHGDLYFSIIYLVEFLKYECLMIFFALKNIHIIRSNYHISEMKYFHLIVLKNQQFGHGLIKEWRSIWNIIVLYCEAT